MTPLPDLIKGFSCKHVNTSSLLRRKMLGSVCLKEILFRLENKHKTSAISFYSHHETAEALSTLVALLHFLAIAFAIVVIGLFIVCPVQNVEHIHLLSLAAEINTLLSELYHRIRTEDHINIHPLCMSMRMLLAHLKGQYVRL